MYKMILSLYLFILFLLPQNSCDASLLVIYDYKLFTMRRKRFILSKDGFMMSWGWLIMNWSLFIVIEGWFRYE
ncbi:hypothetical protein F4774DRAFT_378426 [Daldinia eschscholtzii]|nr:hypothetical protein F4774DRAFT_378426 [Daldinia eschscholtzii]